MIDERDDVPVVEEPEWHILQPIEVKNTDPDVIQPCPDAEVFNVNDVVENQQNNM